MSILRNRIVLFLALIVGLVYAWEFYLKPVNSPIYMAALCEYNQKNYERSSDLLMKAYRIDPNDLAVLKLLGWNHLKTGKPGLAERYFRRACKLAPGSTDAVLGYAYTEMALEKFERAASLLNTLPQNRRDVHRAWAVFYRQAGEKRKPIPVH